jgi:hypothetical protein
MTTKRFDARIAWVCGITLLAASCGLPIADIRSAALGGDVERAIRLAQGELAGMQAAAQGTIDRLVAEPAAEPALLEALDTAPPALRGTLEGWAADDSAVDVVLRTFARARLAELGDGDWQDALRAAWNGDDADVRAYALRGLLDGGVDVAGLIEALRDRDPRVVRVAALGLSRAARQSGGLVADVRAAARGVFAEVADPSIRARLAAVLDPTTPEDLAVLVDGLASDAPAVRVACARMLGRLPDPRAVPQVAALLDGAPTAAGLALAVEAGEHGATGLRETFFARIFQETPADDPLRAGALLALPEGETADNTLRRAVEQGAPDSQVAACERLLAAQQERETCTGVLRQLASAGTPPAAALSAAELLFEEGDAPAAGWLRSFAAAGDPGVRRRVMSVAAARRFDAALLGIGLSDPDPSVAAAAAISAMRVPDPFARPGVAP